MSFRYQKDNTFYELNLLCDCFEEKNYCITENGTARR